MIKTYNLSSNEISISEGEANSALMELDRGLHSMLIGDQCQAIVKFLQFFDKYPFPIFINAAYLKLANFYRTGSNYLKHLIFTVFQQSYKHIDKILNVDELLKHIFTLSYSNDPIARATTLKLLGSISSIIADKTNVHHFIQNGLDSHDNVEVEAAIFASEKFCKQSNTFSVIICEKLSERIQGLATPLSIKLKLIPILQYMHRNIESYQKAISICESVLMTHPTQEFTILILQTLTKLAINSKLNPHKQMDLLLKFAITDLRSEVVIECLKDLKTLTNNMYENYANLIEDNAKVEHSSNKDNVDEKDESYFIIDEYWVGKEGRIWRLIKMFERTIHDSFNYENQPNSKCSPVNADVTIMGHIMDIFHKIIKTLNNTSRININKEYKIPSQNSHIKDCHSEVRQKDQSNHQNMEVCGDNLTARNFEIKYLNKNILKCLDELESLCNIVLDYFLKSSSTLNLNFKVNEIDNTILNDGTDSEIDYDNIAYIKTLIVDKRVARKQAFALLYSGRALKIYAQIFAIKRSNYHYQKSFLPSQQLQGDVNLLHCDISSLYKRIMFYLETFSRAIFLCAAVDIKYFLNLQNVKCQVIRKDTEDDDVQYMFRYINITNESEVYNKESEENKIDNPKVEFKNFFTGSEHIETYYGKIVGVLRFSLQTVCQCIYALKDPLNDSECVQDLANLVFVNLKRFFAIFFLWERTKVWSESMHKDGDLKESEERLNITSNLSSITFDVLILPSFTILCRCFALFFPRTFKKPRFTEFMIKEDPRLAYLSLKLTQIADNPVMPPILSCAIFDITPTCDGTLASYLFERNPRNAWSLYKMGTSALIGRHASCAEKFFGALLGKVFSDHFMFWLQALENVSHAESLLVQTFSYSFTPDFNKLMSLDYSSLETALEYQYLALEKLKIATLNFPYTGTIDKSDSYYSSSFSSHTTTPLVFQCKFTELRANTFILLSEAILALKGLIILPVQTYLRLDTQDREDFRKIVKDDQKAKLNRRLHIVTSRFEKLLRSYQYFYTTRCFDCDKKSRDIIRLNFIDKLSIMSKVFQDPLLYYQEINKTKNSEQKAPTDKGSVDDDNLFNEELIFCLIEKIRITMGKPASYPPFYFRCPKVTTIELVVSPQPKYFTSPSSNKLSLSLNTKDPSTFITCRLETLLTINVEGIINGPNSQNIKLARVQCHFIAARLGKGAHSRSRYIEPEISSSDSETHEDTESHVESKEDKYSAYAELAELYTDIAFLKTREKMRRNPERFIKDVAIHNDYFNVQFLLEFPIIGFYTVMTDCSIIDSNEQIWETGPHSELHVKITSAII
ncbi:unnamed protein product [Gordionus sp. m RMFG-2023]|uniref:integrator complex subunit 7-like n=1 Tax=Gordionus sp. m RMFG-2023 TaxID=3053472 RepID=UPI0030DDDEEE